MRAVIQATMALAAIAGLPISTLAADYATQNLLQDCRGLNGPSDSSFCLGYLAGASGILSEMHDEGVDMMPTHQDNVRLVVSACSEGVTAGAMRQAFIKADIHATAPFLHPTRACARRRDGREPRQN